MGERLQGGFELFFGCGFVTFAMDCVPVAVFRCLAYLVGVWKAS